MNCFTNRKSGWIVLLLGLLIFLGAVLPAAVASAAYTWGAKNGGTAVSLQVPDYGNGRWVVPGFGGWTTTSTDNGQTWVAARPEPAVTSANNAAHYAANLGIWALVGTGGKVYTSGDGVNWTRQTSGVGGALYGVTSDSTRLVAVGAGGAVIRSTDGVTWTAGTSGETSVLYAVAYGEGAFVFVGASGKIRRSVDGGASWTAVQPGGFTSALYNITYANGRFVAVGDGGKILTSTDGGMTWSVGSNATAATWYDVAYGGGKWVLVGSAGKIISSADLSTWDVESSGVAGSIYGVGFGGGYFVASGGATGAEILLVAQGLSSDANLSGLSISSGALTPGFAAGDTSYTAPSVPFTTSSVNVTAAVNYAAASVTVNGSAATSGSPKSVNLNVGVNTIAVTVTAEDGATTKTYTISVTRAAPSGNNNLSALSISPGALNETFDSATLPYTATVGYPVTSIAVTATLAEPGTATMTVNGTATPSGTARTINLNVGTNSINVVVTAQNGTNKTYTITVTRAAASNNANLSNLVLSTGTLSPAFAAGTTSYTATVGNAVTSLNVTPTVAYAASTLKVNGASVTSGSATNVPLTVGENPVSVAVTAEDGTTTKTYTITVTRLSNNANLAGLTLSEGTLSPAFDAATTAYTASVAYRFSPLTITATKADTTATLKVNGSAATSGTGASVDLNVGANPIPVAVTAQDGTVKTYTVTITREPAATNNDLSNLVLSAGSLSPAFASGTDTYSATVSSSVTTLNVTPTLANAQATLKIEGAAAVSGNATSVALNVGLNVIEIDVTAESGATKRYTVNVTRLSGDATLASLVLSMGTLDPVFSPGTTSYTAVVGSSIAEVDLTATVSHAGATLKILGLAIPSGATATKVLNIGPNTVTYTVTAEDTAVTTTYTLNLIRASSDLSSLSLGGAALAPAFDKDTLAYSATVIGSVANINVTPTLADSTATVKVNGTDATSGSASNVALNYGANTINVKVTARDASTKTYTITVTRLSDNANLSGLVLSQGALTPAFDAATTAYTATVPYRFSSLTITATKAHAGATLKVNGTDVISGAAESVSLNVGANPIAVKVTAEDGTVQTYTVTVTREPASTNNTLSGLVLGGATLNPAFDAGTLTYTATVGSTVGSVTVTPTVADAQATLTVKGDAKASGTTSTINLSVGTNPVPVVVTAEDGSTKTYTITVTRLSGDATLFSLGLSDGSLTPAFDPTKTAYEVTVGKDTATLDLTPTLSHASASVKVNGNAVVNGSPETVSLNIGENTIPVLVTAQDTAVTQTYTLTVIRASADLSSLTISSGTLTPAFDKGTFTYSATVSNSVTSLDVTAALADATADLTVNNTTATSGTAFAVPLTVGTNPIAVKVAAADNTTQTYTVTVTRQSADATLSSLGLGAGTLDPAFDAAVTGYTVIVGKDTATLNVTPTVNHAGATVKVDGNGVVSGNPKAVTLGLGSNTVTVEVTAQDTAFTTTYTLTVIRASADLNGLTISAGTLDPVFGKDTVEYDATVSGNVATINVTPTLADGTATVKVDGVNATNGSASTVTLDYGANPIDVLVTARDNTTKTYTVDVYRQSDNASLSGLSLSQGTLSPAFSATFTGDYTATVLYAVDTVSITPTRAHAAASLKVNDSDAISGTAFPVALTVGVNTIAVKVTAEDGTVQTYTVKVTREPASTNNNLSGLVLGGATMTPAFDADEIDYAATVSSTVESVTVKPTVADTTADLTVKGDPATSGAAQTINLIVGENVIPVVVTAENGAPKTYTITVTRLSGDATLSSLAVSPGSLNRTFDPAELAYTVIVGKDTTTLNVTPTLNHAGAAVKVNGESVVSGNPKAVTLSLGSNTVSVTVTAEDTAVTRTYTLTVIRASAELTNLAISEGTLTPTFDKVKDTYTATVSSGVTGLNVTSVMADATATLTVNNTAATSGTAFPVTLNVGANPIAVKVSARDGTAQTYTVTVTRQSNDATLSSLGVNPGSLDSAFDPADTSYTVIVGKDTATLNVTPTLNHGGATVKVDGNSVVSGNPKTVSLSYGSNTVTVEVTAEDTAFTETYTLTVIRASADLSGLALSAGTLAPAFDKNQVTYTATVANAVETLTVSPALFDSTASVKVGTDTAAPFEVALIVGETDIPVEVTARDGTVKTYTVTVTRLSNNANLSSLAFSTGTLNTPFAQATTGYTLSVAHGTTSLTVTPTLADNRSSLTVNGTAKASGTAVSIPISETASTAITVAVTAQDGTPKTYTVDVWPAPVYTAAGKNTSQLISAGSRPAGLEVSGISPVTFALDPDTDLPAGITLNTADGTFSGSATTIGTATATIVVSDAYGGTDSTDLEIRVQRAPAFTSAPANTVQLVSTGAGLSALLAEAATGESLKFYHTSGTLPPGITAFNDDGTFTGTVTTVGVTDLTFRVEDTHGGQATTALRVTVQAAPAFTGAPTNTAQTTSTGAGLTALETTSAAGETLTFTVKSGALPAGISMNSSTGAFTGVATAAGTSTATIEVTDTHGGKKETTLAVTVLQGPIFTTDLANTRQALYTGEAVQSLKATADTGVTITFSLVSGALPAGITLNPDGTFTGVANTVGTTTVTIAAVDNRGGRATTELTLSVAVPIPNPAITVNGGTFTTQTPTITGSVANVAEGAAVSVSVGSQSYSATVQNRSWSVAVTSALPVGTHSVSASVRGINGLSTSGTATITIRIVPVLQPIAEQTNKVGDRINMAVSATGATGSSLTYSAAGLPENLSIDPVSGVITGNTTKVGTYAVTVTVRDTVGGGETSQTFAWRVLRPNVGAVSGLVTDAITGKPISGATVSLQGPNAQSATTDSDGVYTFVAVSSLHTFTLQASHPKYLAASSGELSLPPGEMITQDFRLVPLGGLTITSPAERSLQRTPPAITGTMTGSGTVSVTVNGRPAGAVMVNAEGNWQVTPDAALLHVGPNTVGATAAVAGATLQAPPVTFIYSPKGGLGGTVRTEGGAPVPNQSVDLLDPAGVAVGSTATGADGSYSFGDLPVGTYTVKAGAASAQVAVEAGKNARQDLTVSTKVSLSLAVSPTSLAGDGSATANLTVTATLADGRPAAGVDVQLSATAGALSGATVTTSASGTATATLTAPSLTGMATASGTVTATVEGAESSVVVQFVPASITGVVRDTRTGKPVAGAKVAVAEDFNLDGVIDFAAETITGEDGTYVIYVPRGNWTYQTHITMPVTIRGRTFNMETVQESEVGDLTERGQQFDADPTLSGQLLVATAPGAQPLQPGQALTHGEKVTAQIRRPGTDESQPLEVSPEGTYSVGKLAPGEYQVVIAITTPDGQQLAGTTATVTVTEDGELNLQTVLIDPYGTVTDAVTGKPIDGVTMNLLWADTELNRSKGRKPHSSVELPVLPDFAPNQNRMPQNTTAGGQYAWMVFPDGDYYIVAEKEGYQTYDSRQEGRTVAALPGEDSWVTKGIIHVGETIVLYDLQMNPKGRHNKYVSGYPDGTFGPDRPITRAEVATVLAKLTGAAADPTRTFADVGAAHWAAAQISAVAAKGIMLGDPNGSFRPDDPVTRAEVAVIVGRLRTLAPGVALFPDVQGHWAAAAIGAAKGAGILSGYPDGNFRPEQPTTRAEFVTIINRTLERGPLTGVVAPTFADVPPDHWAFGQVEEAAVEHGFERLPDGAERVVR